MIELPLTAVLSRLFPRSFNSSALLPHSALELTVWIAMAATAGFCEELIFRGYLLRQFASWTRKTWLAVVLQGIVFGLVHGYQGKIVIVISLIGCLFGVLASWRKSLLPGMLAHGLQDSLSGIIGFVGK